MYVSDLALNDYRSYRELVLQLPPGAVVFLGRNGRGKTNLVEAVAYLSTFSSHRVSADRALVRRPLAQSEPEAPVEPDAGRDPGAARSSKSASSASAAAAAGSPEPPTAAVIRARVHHGSQDRLLELEIVQGKANRARLNRGPVPARELLGSLRTVMFAPEDLQLLRGEPGARRRFLDEISLQLKPAYAGLRRDLEQVLRQRAAVLKQLGPHADLRLADDYLAGWDEALARLSAQVSAHRLSVIASLRPGLKRHYRNVSEDDKPVELEYRSHLEKLEARLGLDTGTDLAIPLVDNGYFPDLSAPIEQLTGRYLAALRARRAEELRRAVNLVGAHRDDFEAELATMPVKGYASQGETWSVVLSLRLAQMDLLTADEDTPVLILDDVFAELDERRRLALVQSIAPVQQVLITAAVPTDIPAQLEPARFEVTLDEQLVTQVSPLGASSESVTASAGAAGGDDD
ncbi:DNA replication/repair protein RecF [Actinomyces sp. F1_1611]